MIAGSVTQSDERDEYGLSHTALKPENSAYNPLPSYIQNKNQARHVRSGNSRPLSLTHNALSLKISLNKTFVSSEDIRVSSFTQRNMNQSAGSGQSPDISM